MKSVILLIGVACLIAGQENLQDQREVANANNDFTTSLYNKLRESVPGNLIFSPFSLSSAMAMVKAGAKGVTADEIQRGMHFPSDQQLYSGYKSLLSTLQSNENFTLETANRVYSQTGFALNEDYVKTLKNNFNAETTQLDFSQASLAANQINGWVENVTRSKIKDLVSSSDFDALTRLVLVNAIYFKGLWANKFDPDSTQKAPFNTGSENITVDMMRSESEYPYIDLTSSLDAKAIALPYKGNRLSMIVLLPNKVDGLADLERRLQKEDTVKLADIPDKMRSRKVILYMPKFKLETRIDLGEVLSGLGMKSMFQDNADFSGISAPGSNEKLKVSKAVQKAFIEVNEEGSEAAAATGIQLMLKSSFSGTVLRCNHPFLTMIFDNSTSTILFVDSLVNPLIESSEVKPRHHNEVKSRDNLHVDQQKSTSGLYPTCTLPLIFLTITLTIITSFLH